MMKLFKVLVCISLVLVLLFTCGIAVADTSANGKAYVRFMTNCTEQITLQSGRKAVAQSTMFSSQQVDIGGKLSQVQGAPERAGYDFGGWSTDIEGNNLWNFDTPVQGNMILYAKWTRSQQQQEEQYVEPIITFTEKVDNSVNGIDVYGVLNIRVQNGTVKLTKASLKLLENNSNNVQQLLNYKINSDCRIVSATYRQNAITVKYNNGTEQTLTINVVDDSVNYVVNNSTYESKAVKYENNVQIAPYNVLLAGSSSMENWTTSTVDMAPVTTANVGIGGTTVEQWRDCLATRLIYPYSPRAVILYVGVNNIINAGSTGKETGDALIELFDDIHEHLPDCAIYYVLINYVPGYYVKHGNDMTTANNIVKDYAKTHDYMCLIDAGSLLMKTGEGEGKPNTAYFLTDGLHMSLCGYTIWGGEVKKQFILHETELYK